MVEENQPPPRYSGTREPLYPGVFGPIRRILVGVGLLALIINSGCRPNREAPGPSPADLNLEAVVQEALVSTMPETPVQITFDFRLKEADLRFEGRGVARVEPPYRVRIDLFSNRGEGLFRAALVGGDLRVPLGVPRELAPPPALLWAALGVFRPDSGLRVEGGRGTGNGRVTLRYRGDAGEDLRFYLANGLLTRAEIYEGGHLIEEVDLELDESSENVVETVYRNRALFLELTFSLKSVETVDSFPSEIWDPGR
ncbi:MAG: hypothetical protein MUO50_02005 [Longimicrobiales bacterium]|nr:hypothetical protein [Longimicrobiales bacterium]